ncbi:MAG: NAD-dependent DNA ligase LigA [Opitutaceae bacterium]|nr:NAD-dependent DNA ligase LigA [Opitutaceae bacterium]
MLALLLLSVAAFAATPPLGAPAPTPAAVPATTADAGARIAALRGEIARHNELYFRRSAPEITDSTFDSLRRELAALEADFPALAAAAPPEAAPPGDDRNGDFPTARHRAPMLGIEKVYTEAELRHWHRLLLARLGRRDAALVVEPKIDGLAISVTFEHGRLVRAVTRGSGTEGDEITANVRTIPTLPTTLRSAGAHSPPPALIELRGELYISPAEFARLNLEREAAGEPPFAHPRNLAAGTAKLHDPAEVAARHLALVFYGWGAWEPTATQPASQQKFLEQANAWGLPTIPVTRLARSADELWAAVGEVARQRDQLPFPADGAVAKLDSVPLRRSLGETEQAPRWTVAYKFPPDRASTRLRAISIQIGRTGVLTPVAELVPVPLAGASIARATLHNRDTIARLDLRVGDTVTLERAGGVVPHITGVDLARRPAESAPYVFPDKCPACSTAVAQGPGEALVRCPNPICPAQVRQRLDHYTGRHGVRIQDLGPATITMLVDRGLVRDIPDLYRLRRGDLLALPGFGPTSADALLDAIERSRHARLWRAINGLGLPRVGTATAKKLGRHFTRLEQLANATYGELIPVVGTATARALVAHLAEPGNRATLTALAAIRSQP